MAPLATKRRTRSCRSCGSERKWHVCTAAAGGHHPPEAVPAADQDLISDLPDELLCAIVSFLPTKDGARTQGLSRRWRTIWPAATLDLDGGDFGPRYAGADLSGLITRILSGHCGCVRRLRLATFHHTATMDSLFQPTVLDKLEELHFRYRFAMAEGDPLPLSALRFTELRVASYGLCYFPDDPGGVTFPKLRELILYKATISEISLNAMISACPDLRSLFLRDSIGFHRVCISSPTLVRLGFSVNSRSPVMEELVVVNAPSMEKLLLFKTFAGPRNIRVMFAPKLEVLGCLSSDMRNVELQSTIFKSYTKMIIQNDQGYAPLECLDRHLKKMQIINYEEDKSADVNFIKFFVLNAQVLESLKIVVRQGQCDAKWIASQYKKLQVDARVSLGARLDFEAENTCRFPRSVDINHFHDLSMDPFDGSLCFPLTVFIS
ncbi:unnamed protein product [Urochloa decumbens]|uniref:F-box domain-containing protein n=1 Tax=Urochloa decumbens TaxID=240449 RepID=A0ABC9G805_9POAL